MVNGKICSGKSGDWPQNEVREGPVWQADTNTLSWVDILSGTLHILQGGQVLSIETGQYIGAAVPTDTKGQYLAALTTGFYLMDQTGLIGKIGSPLDMPLRYVV